MTPDPLLMRLRHSDPARHVDIDEARAGALLQHLRSEIAGGEPRTRMARSRSGLAQVGQWVPAAVAIAITVLVVAVFATSVSRHPSRLRSSGPSRGAAGSGEQPLLSILGVLRRPQTARDRRAFAQSGLAHGVFLFANLGTVNAASARLATVTPWGSRVGLAIVDKASGGQAGLLEWNGHGGGGGVAAAQIEAGRDVSTQGWGASYAGGSTGVREEVVVPDGVTRVTFVLSQSAATRSSGPSYAEPLRITVAVHGNVAAFEARRSGGQGITPMIWYAADGRVIKEIGNVDATEHTRPVTHPRPTPPTALSRAAQRDPGTANPVSVTPGSAGPGSTVRISWRLLLTGAAYQFDSTGPQGANCYGADTIPGGLSGGTTDVRGQRYGEALGPLTGHDWCPGTYHVSVNVLSLGAGRPSLHPTPRPFGAVTFTVR